MELRVLRYFLAVAREQNITAAANFLHVSQPTLSRQLMDLEAEFGKRLMIRGNRRVTLTSDGQLLRKRAEVSGNRLVSAGAGRQRALSRPSRPRPFAARGRHGRHHRLHSAF